VDIRSETEFAAEEAEHGYEEEEVQGRCAAVLSNGRRCPNASLPNSRYCGIESHQALANIATDNVADLPAAASNGDTADESAAQDIGDGVSDVAEPAVEQAPPEQIAPAAAEEQAT
jgi:N utilization substance protein A